MVKDEIVREIGDSWYTVKVDGTRDPTGCENISIVIRFLAENYDVKERLLTIATTDAFDALSLTNTVIAEITKAGLSTSKMLSQCYDGASLMSGRHRGVQKLMQKKLEREIPYIHCFNHQLHLVIVHAMSSKRGVEEFFNVYDSLYKFIRKPTVAVHYKGEKLKRLLEQRWTGHYGTVSVIIKSFDSIFELLTEVENT
nr:PREDICTED: zinc finger MYM-type protein 6-like [Latimeria chalumnae]|eukprot:XP_014352815.1 PREDICTED: zinc finger MYM-type protein 6-like [Latimeria chalumnae]